jgi:hypothetical protein
LDRVLKKLLRQDGWAREFSGHVADVWQGCRAQG